MAVRLLSCLMCLMLACGGLAVQAQTTALPAGITNPAEYTAYLNAVGQADAEKRASALEIFLAWYPNSVLRVDACEQAMAAWQTAGNPAKADAVAVHLLQIDPDNVRALVNRAYSGRAQAMAGDANALPTAVAAAQRGIAALPKWRRPTTMADPDFTRLKMQIVAVFDGTLGYAALQAKDYAKARSHFLEAVAVEPDNLADAYQLSVALLEGQPTDPLGFWYAARAMAIARAAKNETAAAGIEKYARARYGHYHGSDKGWDKVVARVAAGERLPPDNFAATITRQMSPAETAVQLAAGADPATLSFAEWELILAHRDDTPENKAAAEKVWKAIQDKQHDGARLKLAVKVIDAKPDVIEAALSEDSKVANKVDLEIGMAYALRPLPAAGATISIIGTLADYKTQPFLFRLTKAELAEESMSVAGGACADPRPQMCTRDYRPSCGILKDGSHKTFGNACSACADPEVITQAAGACP